jgi:hypothetical protein
LVITAYDSRDVFRSENRLPVSIPVRCVLDLAVLYERRDAAPP